LKWYRLAAERGNAYAQNSLGMLYAEGHGVMQDYVLAHMWFNRKRFSDRTLMAAFGMLHVSR
jgi:Sel1 repeat